jgi:hypothetical protein
MSGKILILDIAIPAFFGNRILDPVFAAKIPGGSIWPLFAKKAEARGWRVMTADVFLASDFNPSAAVCVSNEGTPDTVIALTRRGVEMAVIWSGESPNVAWDFYHDLAQRARPFQHAFVFRGFHPRLSQGVEPHAYRWPNPRRRCDGLPWDKRGIVVMVASAKQRIAVNHARLLSRLAWGWRWLKVRRLQMVDPMLRFPDLYESRMQAIENLALRPGFRLFGQRWTVARQYSGRFRRIRFDQEPVECEDKLATICNYRFNLCLENCEYPGYLTEKIFDAMLAGTVPVYWGAPDVTDFIPQECFIDLRSFSDWDELWERLATMTHNEWQSIRHAIEDFLASPEYLAFNEDSVAQSLIEWSTQELHKVG